MAAEQYNFLLKYVPKGLLSTDNKLPLVQAMAWHWAGNKLAPEGMVTHYTDVFMSPGPWFNIKMSSYQYRKSHWGDKTVVRSSYLHNGISYTGKMASYIESGPRGHFKNTYELFNLRVRALEFSPVEKIYIFQCMGKIFCVEFQRYPLKFHIKHLIHALKYMIFIQHWNFKSS